MRIGLDARILFCSQRRGMGKSLLRLYQTLGQVRRDWEVVAYHREVNPDRSLLPEADLRMIEMPGDRFDAWQQWRLPMAARRDGLNVLHCPANHCPRWMPVPTVVTIHDLIPLDLPETLHPQQVRRFRRSVAQAAKVAAAITCPSAYTRQRLIEGLGITSDRIHITPWGSDEPTQVSDAHDAMHRHRVRQPFVLHFGSHEHRKNTKRLIEAWAMLRRGARRHATLLIVGLSVDAQQAFFALCQKLGVDNRVVLEGFVSDADAASLLRSAEFLAYPSLSEGFGLPILEAYAAETAVLTSNRTSLPEVAGEAAVIVDPTDVIAMSNAMGKLLRDPVLRRDLVKRGRSQLANFSWHSCAEAFANTVEAATGVNEISWQRAA